MRGKWLLIAVGVAIVAGAGWGADKVLYRARLGTAYAAKQTCSCLFIAHRSMASCSTDYAPADVRQLHWRSASDGVTVTALGGRIARRAVFEPGFGCHLVN